MNLKMKDELWLWISSEYLPGDSTRKILVEIPAGVFFYSRLHRTLSGSGRALRRPRKALRAATLGAFFCAFMVH